MRNKSLERVGSAFGGHAVIIFAAMRLCLQVFVIALCASLAWSANPREHMEKRFEPIEMSKERSDTSSAAMVTWTDQSESTTAIRARRAPRAQEIRLVIPLQLRPGRKGRRGDKRSPWILRIASPRNHRGRKHRRIGAKRRKLKSGNEVRNNRHRNHPRYIKSEWNRKVKLHSRQKKRKNKSNEHCNHDHEIRMRNRKHWQRRDKGMRLNLGKARQGKNTRKGKLSNLSKARQGKNTRKGILLNLDKAWQGKNTHKGIILNLGKARQDKNTRKGILLNLGKARQGKNTRKGIRSSLGKPRQGKNTPKGIQLVFIKNKKADAGSGVSYVRFKIGKESRGQKAKRQKGNKNRKRTTGFSRKGRVSRKGKQGRTVIYRNHHHWGEE
ncbi:predicted protein [Nematostella vectensis]|uniref:Uncharacterized protein n=1 Tax=Nematostella vectensis TaxID=45351 RepID=A7RHQ1_NEMVE|nr:predicted protein [Nematostella vectensis]|eukprot:XP_001641081.1 predicted protein [Nematostella vectensis]